jgi:acetyl esterase
MRRLAEHSRMAGRHSGTHGRELLLDTQAGRVRVLGYNLNRPERMPLFVNIHGGGFVFGHPEMDDPFMPRVALEAQVKILSVDYTLSPDAVFPTALHECAGVIRYAQTHAEEFGIDPERIAVGGHSAGGTLSAALCILNAETRDMNLRALILDYPALDMVTPPDQKPSGRGLVARYFLNAPRMRMFTQCYCPDEGDLMNPLVSPFYATDEVIRTFPPTLFLTAGKDPLCAEAIQYAQRLRQAGVETTRYHFENAPHGFTLFKGENAQTGWTRIIEHLCKHL